MKKQELLIIKDEVLNFQVPKQKKCIIKVIGVGGGGGNAVNHMYHQGIHDVSFAVCNLDAQALNDSPVPYRLQLGHEGLGAGNRPQKAAAAAEESIEDIRKMLNDGTRMAFITAGMGGGTGTGAAPIIAREAKALDILTVGIVTIPFKWEGKPKINQALDGVEEMAKNVDALLVINNERLLEIYSDLALNEAFAKADDTLSVAAKSISDIITFHGIINLDFNDVRTVMKDGGVAIMSTAYGEGEHRITQAVENALHSPLLNNNDIFKSKKFLFNITFSAEDGNKSLKMDEMNEVNEFMSKFGDDIEVKWGLASDATLGDKVKVTILATGFGVKDVADKDVPVYNVDDLARKEYEDERYQIYYRPDNALPVKREYYTYTFTAETLDNDDVISMLETKPTYMRKPETLKSIQAKDQQEAVLNSNASGDVDNMQSIDFTVNG